MKIFNKLVNRLSLFLIPVSVLFSWQAGAAQTCSDNIEATTPSSRFSVIERANGIQVTDFDTGLIWQQCALGLSGENCATGTLQAYTWQEALQVAQETSESEGENWRVPNIKELTSIIEEQCVSPAINLTVFPNSSAVYHWSSTTYGPDPVRAWHVSVGRMSFNTKDESEYVRLVRTASASELLDADRDGLLDNVDYYPTIAIGDLLDTDNDGIPDTCDQACLDLGMTADVYANGVIYVNDDSTCNALAETCGTSWATAFPYLQDALAQASGNNNIWLAEGAYYPDDNAAGDLAGDHTAKLTMVNQVGLYGGFSDDGLATQLSDADPESNITVLSGDIDQDDNRDDDDITLSYADVLSVNSYFLIKDNVNVEHFTLQGLTLTAAIGNAIYVDYSGASLKQLTFIANNGGNGVIYFYKNNSGGGNCQSILLDDILLDRNDDGQLIYFEDYSCDSIILKNIVADNNTIDDALLLENDSDITIENLWIKDNNTLEEAIHVSLNTANQTVTLQNSVLKNATVQAISLWKGKLIVNNSTISGNSQAVYFNDALATLELNHVTIVDNHNVIDKPIIDMKNSLSLSIKNSIIAGNTLNGVESNIVNASGAIVDNGYNLIGSNNVSGISDAGAGNFASYFNSGTSFVGNQAIENELSLTSLTNGGTAESHLLNAGGFAIDAIPLASCDLTTDQRGQARPYENSCDIGAVEVQLDTDFDGIEDFVADLDGDGVLNQLDFYPLISLSGLTDSDNDGIPDTCDQACLDLGMTADVYANGAIYVNDDSSCNALTETCGTSWATAFPYLQDALAQAWANNNIWLAEGVYYPDDNAAGDLADDDFSKYSMVNQVGLYGGFSNDGLATQLSDADPESNITVLSGDIDQDDNRDDDDITLSYADVLSVNSYFLIKDNVNVEHFTLQGLTLTAAIGNAIYVDYSGASLKQLTFIANNGGNDGVISFYNSKSGGGNCKSILFDDILLERNDDGQLIYFEDYSCDSIILKNIVADNNTIDDALLLENDSDITIENLWIKDNNTLEEAIHVSLNTANQTVTLQNSVLKNATVQAISLWKGKLIVNNSTISGNSQAVFFNNVSAMLELNHVTIVDNHNVIDKPIIDMKNSLSLSIKNSIIAGNTLNGVESNIVNASGVIVDNGYNLIGSNNVSGISDAGAGDFARYFNSGTSFVGNQAIENELSLTSLTNGGTAESHLLNAGGFAIDVIPLASCDLTSDQRGQARPYENTCDIGAVEVQLDTDFDGIEDFVDTDDDGDGISDLQEIENGTNPLNTDSDNDGVLDNEDDFPLDNTESLDTDNDNIGNNADTDDDGDGMPDVYELANNLDPLDDSDTFADADGDHQMNIDEYTHNTNPQDDSEFISPLQLSFGEQGVVTNFVFPDKFTDDEDSDLIKFHGVIGELSDQRLVIPGYAYDNSSDEHLFSFSLESNGTENSSYADNGFYLSSFGDESEDVISLIVIGLQNQQLIKYADNKLVVLDSTGVVDNTFSDDGIFSTVDAENISTVYALASGKYLIASQNLGDELGYLYKVNNDGSIDNDFGVNGQITFTDDDNGISSKEITTIIEKDDSKILVLTAEGDIVRLNSDGSIDDDFNFNSLDTRHSGGFSLQDEGKMLVVYNKSIIKRLNSDGSTDTDFNGDGVVNLDTLFDSYRAGSSFVTAQLPDGKIIVASTSDYDDTTIFQVIRLLANGEFDTSYDKDGIAHYSTSKHPNISASRPIITSNYDVVFTAASGDYFSGDYAGIVVRFANQSDSDGDGIIDEEDEFPFDPNNGQILIAEGIAAINDATLATCISDVGLTYVNELTSLTCEGVAVLTGIEAFTQLTELSLREGTFTDVNDLSPLTELIDVDLSHGLVTDYSGLFNATKLTIFINYGYLNTDLAAVSGLTNVENLQIYSDVLTSLEGIQSLTNLTGFYSGADNVTDLSQLPSLPNLIHLYLHFPLASDFSSVLKNSSHLTYLDLNSSRSIHCWQKSYLDNANIATYIAPNHNDEGNDGCVDTGNNEDYDNDGISNIDEIDTYGTNPALADTDNDGVTDKEDALPLDSTESVDTDGDGTGNNADTDDDGDGALDIADVFPLDSLESVDTDSDGRGNNADNDDDGDGLPDVFEELYAFLDPLNVDDALNDQDNDGFSNLAEFHAVTNIDDINNTPNDSTTYKIFSPEGGEYDAFGNDIAISGNTTMVNSLVHDAGINFNLSFRHVSVFDKNAQGEWLQTQTLMPPTDESFQSAISLFGNTAMVAGLKNGSGVVYVYEKDDMGNWGLSTTLTASDNGYGGFGEAISLKEDTALIGAYGLNNAEEHEGAGYIFQRINETWSEQQVLKPDVATTSDRFARVVSLSGGENSIALIGADGDSTNASSGAAYIFEQDEMNGTWYQATKLLPANGKSGDLFGRSLSIDENIALIGAYRTDNVESASGSVYVYAKDDNGDWGEHVELVAEDPTFNKQFGNSVSIKGQHIIIGAYGDGSAADYAGASYLFYWDKEADSFKQVNKLTAPDAVSHEAFGSTVIVTSNTLVIGIDSEESNGYGSVYFITPDYDNDGVLNDEDAFPFDETESVDTDGDGVGDNADLDDDGDGVNDDVDPEPLNPAVFDITNPVLSAPENLLIAAINNSGTPATDTDISTFLTSASASDNFDGAITVSNNAPIIFPLGVTTVTFNATDSSGNTGSAQATVTVIDQSIPLITLTGNTAIILSVGDSYVEAGFSALDNVDGDLTANVVSGGSVITSVVGVYTLTYNVSDAAGNAALTQTRHVTVQDAAAPSIITPNNITVAAVDADGTAASDTNIGLFLTSANATDDVDGVITVSNDAPTIFPLGVTTVTFSATDNAGNTGSAQATVTVIDQSIPLITLTGNTAITLSVGDSYVEAGFSALDNVDGDLTANVVSGGSVITSVVGVYTLTYNVSDAAGNAALTQTRHVTVQDAAAPSIITPNNITVAAVDADGTAASDTNIGLFLTSANATDDVDGVITVSNDAPTIFPLGVTTVTFSATDNAGNTGSAQATVTVIDQSIPVITLTGNTAITLSVGDSYVEAGFSALDNVDGDLTANVVSGGSVITSVVGVYTLTYNVSDAAGNAALTQTRHVTVQDAAAPSIITPNNITVAAVDADGTAASDTNIGLFLTSANATDDVDGVITVSNDAPTIFPLGVTTVTFSATDNAGNTGSAQATVTVLDQSIPLITLTGNTAITLSVGDSYVEAGFSAFDNVDGDLTANVVSGGSVITSVVGVYTLTYNVSDAAGNAALTQTRHVTVQDAAAPSIITPNNITVAAVDADGTAASDTNIGLFLTSANATDDVDGVITVSNNAPTIFPLGVTTVTFSATDNAGNTGAAQATVTVLDQSIPLITLTGNTAITLSVGDSYVEAGFSALDNVDGDLTANVVSGGSVITSVVGVYTLTYNVSDAAGNAALAQSRQVTVQDAAAPVIISPNNITVAAVDANGTPSSSSAVTSFINSANATDIVDGILTITNDAPSVFPLGETTVTFSATDSSSNTGSAQATVTVIDQSIPLITLTGNTAIILSVGDSYVEAGFSALDNVDGDLTANVVSGGSVITSVVGVYTLTYNVSDAAGNVALTQTRHVTVQDAAAPSIITPNNITVAAVDADGTAASDTNIDLFLTSANAIDDVDGALDVENDAPSVFPLGVTTVTFSATDSSSNTGLAQATVTVLDQSVPLITLTGNTAITLSVGDSYVEAGFSALDNVDGNLTANVVSGGSVITSVVGVYTLTYNVSDAAGNVALTQTRHVTVQDAAAPSIITPNNITVAAADADGTAASDNNIGLFLTSANAVDNVDGALDVENDAPSVFPLGVTTVTFSATDNAGNTGSAQATVTVLDQSVPVITLTGNTAITLSVGDSYVEAGFSALDNVDGDLTANVVSGGSVITSVVGVYTLTYNVSDAAGNVALTQTRQVTVQAIAPLDSDGDGVTDDEDAFPFDATETTDTDGDGIGNNTDTDDDSDGVDDVNDAFPLDSSESVDTDGDGVGNNADTDDDNDGILDENDDEPLTPFVDTQAPVFAAIEPATYEATGEVTDVSLATPIVTDNYDAEPLVVSDIAEALALGEHLITWTATDAAGNHSSAVQTVNIVDTSEPVFENIEPLVLNAQGRLSDITDLINVNAFDLVDGGIIATPNGGTNLLSGQHSLVVVATDKLGNEATADLSVSIYPQATIRSLLNIESGSTLTIGVSLSGNAPSYPVNITYQLIENSEVVETNTIDIISGTQGSLSVTVPNELVVSDNLSLVITEVENAFIDDQAITKLSVIDTNAAPLLSVSIRQDESNVSVVDPDNGLVTFTASISDVNQGNSHDIAWTSPHDEFDDASNVIIYSIDPADLNEGVYTLDISVTENNTDALLSVTQSVQFVVEQLADLDETKDSDGDGLVDSEEGYNDTDGDGIADYLDDDSNTTQLPSSENTAPMQTTPGLKMSLGSLSQASGGSGSKNASLTVEDLANVVGDNAADTNDSHFDTVTPLYNFTVDGLSKQGDSVVVVIPLENGTTLPADGVYRKYNTTNGWFTFVEDARNSVSSAHTDENGNCPVANDESYTSELTEEDNCIELIIEDGGPNDADFAINGSVEDPGAVVIEQQNSAPAIDLAANHVVDEDTTITLDASNTSDDEGDDLTYVWVQTSGLEVELTDTALSQLTFISPSVVTDETLIFELTVSDGIDISVSSTQVIVYQVNTAPTVSIEEHEESGEEGATIILTSTGSDADQDELSYSWEQLSGPSIIFNDPAASQVSIVLPQVSTDEAIEVQVTVSDGELSTTNTTSFIVTNQVEGITVTPEKESSTGGGSMGWLLLLVVGIRMRKLVSVKKAA